MEFVRKLITIKALVLWTERYLKIGFPKWFVNIIDGIVVVKLN